MDPCVHIPPRPSWPVKETSSAIRKQQIFKQSTVNLTFLRNDISCYFEIFKLLWVQILPWSRLKGCKIKTKTHNFVLSKLTMKVMNILDLARYNFFNLIYAETYF